MTKQPSSSHCFVCGVANVHGLQMSFYSAHPGEVVSNISIPAHFQGYPGMVHGGVIAAMLDEAAGRAFMVGGPPGVSPGDPPRFLVTARLSIRYRKPVPVETPLKVVGRTGKDDGKIAEATGSIYDAGGKLLAEAEAVLVNIPDNLIEKVDPDRLGWKVYPDEEGQG
jgi:acyl-coenzyme A thioesterase PaaI-like protein